MSKEEPEIFDLPIVDTERLLAAQGHLRHTMLVSRVADFEGRTDWGSPALQERRRTRPCDSCGEECFYDPLSSPAPTAATYVCIQCLEARHVFKRMGLTGEAPEDKKAQGTS